MFREASAYRFYLTFRSLTSLLWLQASVLQPGLRTMPALQGGGHGQEATRRPWPSSRTGIPRLVVKPWPRAKPSRAHSNRKADAAQWGGQMAQPLWKPARHRLDHRITPQARERARGRRKHRGAPAARHPHFRSRSPTSAAAPPQDRCRVSLPHERENPHRRGGLTAQGRPKARQAWR